MDFAFSTEINNEFKDYKYIDIKDINNERKKVLTKFCGKYKNIKTKGEIKDLERRWGQYWCKFYLFCGKEKIGCITRLDNNSLINNKVYEVYGNINNGNYGLQFDIEKMDILNNELSPFEKLYSKCVKYNFFKNKKDINISNINKITIVSKKNTQGCTDFKEHLNIPLITSIKDVCLEGDNTSTDIIKMIKSINDKNNTDLIIILRGGGDTSEISKSFDKFDLFKAIRESNIPIATAIGHTKDSKDKLLITEVSDINFDTPSIAATEITKICKEPFYNLLTKYLKEYNTIIDNKINDFDDFFENGIEKLSSKLIENFDKEKDLIIRDLIPGDIVNIEKESFVYAPHKNKYIKYKIIAVEEISISPTDIGKLEEESDLKKIEKILSKYKNEFDFSKNIDKMREINKKIKKIDDTNRKYKNLISKRHENYYLKKIPKLSMTNIYKIKEMFLYYKDIINSIENRECSNKCSITNDTYNSMKSCININETSDILNIATNLSSIINF